MGTTADVNAPSPSSRRNKFGSVKAKMKAEFHKLVPRAAKIKISRTRPKTREPKVLMPITAILRKFFVI
jgi:hypothetical protein